MSQLARHDLETLLSHAGWVRTLARSLTADAHAADDLAQDALAIALVRPPPGALPVRRWLGGILRNLANQRRRAAGRRRERELAVARSEVSDHSSPELLEQLDLHRSVVEAVARLEEPYRAAILMRYFEGLSPAAIAARSDAPLRTVHTRLHRALQRLRADLDRAHGGDREAWALALLPFAAGSKRWTAAAIGTVLMDAKLKIALVAAALLAICTTLVLVAGDPSGPGSGPQGVISAEAELARDAGEHEPRLEDASGARERTAPVPSTDAAATSAAAQVVHRLRVRVIDVDRTPVAGVIVRYVDGRHGPQDGVEVVSDVHGLADFEDLHGAGDGDHLDIASPGWTSVLRPQFWGERLVREHVLVVARSIVLGGVVLDQNRRPIADALVRVTEPPDLRARIDAILDSSATVERSVRTDELGRFDLRDAPLLPGAGIVATHATHVTERRPLPPGDDLGLEIVLATTGGSHARLAGRVVDPEGAGVEGAWVALGDVSTKSGPEGGFLLELETGDPATYFDGAPVTALRAVKSGFLPAQIERPAGGFAALSEPVLLRLGGPPLAIAGRVLDHAGRPVPGADVWTDEETRFGSVEIESEGASSFRSLRSVESMLRDKWWTARERTDAQGRFELAGLLARDYRLRAYDRRSLVTASVTSAAGARNVEIRFSKEDLHARVAGRVRSFSGEPIAGVRVALARVGPGTRDNPTERLETEGIETDALGQFVFERVSHAVDTLMVQDFRLAPGGVVRAIARDADVEKLEIVVPMRVHVQIDGGAEADFDEVAFEDAQGRAIEAGVYLGNLCYNTPSIEVVRGRSEPFSVTEDARVVIVKKEGVELRRVPLKLVLGELNTIRP